MKRAVKVLAIIQVPLLIACALALLLDRDARSLPWAPSGVASQHLGDASGVSPEPSVGRSAASESEDERTMQAGSRADRRKALGEALRRAAARAGSGEAIEAEVERRIAELDEIETHTNAVKREEEQRRMDEVADWFDGLMPHHPENAAKVREILDWYIERRFATYGEMEEIDSSFARSERESMRQTLGDRLLSEVPPAQGVTVLKKLFI